MKLTLFITTLGLCCLTPFATASLLLTGVFDGPLTGGHPKGIEITVLADIADLSLYGVGSANNGGGTDGQEFTFSAISASAGDHLYLTSDSSGFLTYMGFNPDYQTSAVHVNGDDAIELFHNGAVIDTYGDINADGTGTGWDYQDGWAYRNANSTAGNYAASEWTYSGINALDGSSTNAAAGNPIPIGSYTVPEPSSLLLALGGLSLMITRRSRTQRRVYPT